MVGLRWAMCVSRVLELIPRLMSAGAFVNVVCKEPKAVTQEAISFGGYATVDGLQQGIVDLRYSGPVVQLYYL